MLNQVLVYGLLVGFTVVAPCTGYGDEPVTFADQVASIVNQGIADGEMPGAVVVVANRDRILYQQAFGNRQLDPTPEPMTIDTLFDLASLTKPVATATSVMRLVQQGKVELNRPVADYLPEFGARGKSTITIADLLLHVGGLIPDNPLSDYDHGSEIAWQRICDLEPTAPPRQKFAYSDVGFIVLGKLVEQVSGKPLDQFANDEVFSPLGMNETTFNPSEELVARAAPTEQRDDQWIRGQVHDPRAHLLGGVAGHAGLFSIAADLVRYGQMMLSEDQAAVQVLDRTARREMTQPREVPRGTRTYGWDHRSPYSSNRGESLSDGAFGHGGFTGTVLWIDPAKNRIFVFLSNRLHPDGEGSVNQLAGKIATLVCLDVDN